MALGLGPRDLALTLGTGQGAGQGSGRARLRVMSRSARTLPDTIPGRAQP